jgi:molybdopterin-containing oxidoreductase family membrane subunit
MTQVWMALLVLLMFAGVVAFANQYINGLQVTGMRNLVSWGLYIITFTFLIGLSAGGLILSSSAYVFNLKQLKSLAPVGIVVAVACVLGAMAAIIPDMGRPERLLNILFSGRFTSPITWDLTVITLYLIVGLFEAWVLFGARWRNQEEQREKLLKRAAYIAFPIAILVHSITAWIFGLQVGRPFWNSALMAPIFLSSAIVSGLGLILVIAYVGRKSNIPGLGEENRATVARLLSAFILLDLFLLFCELFTNLYSGQPAEAGGALMLVSGVLAPVFWSEIIFGALLPFALVSLSQTRRSTGWLGLAGVLVMLGVFAKRINIILPGFLGMNVPFAPGVSTGQFVPGAAPFSLTPSYMPTLTELTITLGVLAMVAFVVTLGVQMAVGQRSSIAQGARA